MREGSPYSWGEGNGAWGFSGGLPAHRAGNRGAEVSRERALTGRRGQAWLVAQHLCWPGAGGRSAEVGGVGSQRLGRPEGAAFPARVGSMGCNYTAPGPDPAGRERELAGAGRRAGARAPGAPRYFD